MKQGYWKVCEINLPWPILHQELRTNTKTFQNTHSKFKLRIPDCETDRQQITWSRVYYGKLIVAQLVK
jgi:hypothetical protein